MPPRSTPTALHRAVSSLLMMLLLWAADGASAQTRDAITERAYWEEPCTPTTVQQLPLEQFRVFTGLLARGYGECAVWLRLQIDPGPLPAPGDHALEGNQNKDRGDGGVREADDLSPRTLVLRILPSFLDQVELFDPLRPGAAVATTGDRQPPGDQAYRSLALHLLIPRGDAPRDVFLRLHTTSTRMIDVRALTLREALERDRLNELLCAAYLALIGVSLLVAVVHWQRGRDRVVGVFVFKQTIAMLWSLLLLGYGRALLGGWIPAPLIDMVTSVTVVGFVAASLAFDSLLILEYRPPRWGPKVLLAYLGMLPVELLLMSVGYVWLALAANAAVAVVGMITMVATIVLARPATGADAPVPSRWQLALFYAVIAVPVCGSMLTQLGWLPGTTMSLYGLLLHGLLSGVVMVAFLTARARRLRQRQIDAEAELSRTHGLVQQERLHREDREKLLDMLTHELKTPLSVMRMLLGSGVPSTSQIAQIQRSLADINEVVERCSQAGQLEGERLRAHDQPCNVRAELEALVGDWSAAQSRSVSRPLSQSLVLQVDASARMRGQSSGVVQTDPHLLRVVLSNLIDNACKYGAPGCPVTVHLAQHDAQDGREQLLIDIANVPGPAGWPDPQRLFDKYYRSPGAHRQTGSGLGLYLSAGLAQLLGARLLYQPSPTHVCFRLCLPL